MTTTYDPELTARLIAEAREDDARLGGDWRACKRWPGDGTWFVFTGHLKGTLANQPEDRALALVRSRRNLHALADQLEAAQREIERLTAALPNWSHAEALAQRDAMIAANVHAQSELARLRAELESANTARALAELRSDTLDASHAMRDATKLRIAARLGLPATATQGEIADRVDEVVRERDAARAKIADPEDAFPT